MSRPLVTFGDPEALLKTYFEAAFEDREESYLPPAEDGVTTDFPSSPLGAVTHVQIALELGVADHYPVTERAQVRVTCHAGRGHRSNVKNLASLTQGLVYAHPGDAGVLSTKILIGRSEVITDPATQNLMVWFLARLNLKATLLAS